MARLATSSSSNAERAARVMLAVAPHGAAGTTLGELAAEMVEAAPALHRTLTALAKFGFVLIRQMF